MFSAFFFQAEDGIRDGHVTGVQTCALPISIHHEPLCIPTPLTPSPPAISRRSRGSQVYTMLNQVDTPGSLWLGAATLRHGLVSSLQGVLPDGGCRNASALINA